MSQLVARIMPLSLFAALATLLLGWLTATAQSPAASKADWPQFRGPDRTNLSPDKNLLKKWPESGPKLLWKGQGVGIGFSSVAVAGDRVYTMGDKNGAAQIFALSRKTGKLLWGTPIGKAGGNYEGTRCTPTVEGDRVYGIGQFGDLVCLNANTGKLIWRKNFLKDFGGRPGGWQFSESPTLDGDRLIVTPGGPKATVVALDKKTGKEIWRNDAGYEAGYSTVVISNSCGVKQYVQLTAGGTIGVSAADGKTLWRYEKLGNNTANIPTPIVLGEQIFTSAGYGKGGALLTLSGDASSMTVKEEYYKGELRNKHGGILAVGDYIFGDTDDSGRPFCAEWKTGEIKWKRGGRGKDSGSASLTYADGHLYIRYSDGYVVLVPAIPDGYKEVSSFKIPNSDTNSWAHPVVIGGRLYLREKDIVWCYDVSAR